jgi:RNA polymerase sigma factor (sigma-70 family)
MHIVFSPENLALVNENISIVEWTLFLAMRKTGVTPMITPEDLFQEGYIALAKAATYYDGSVQFQTFAQVVVRNAINDYIRKFRQRANVVSLDAAFTEDFSLYDVLVNTGQSGYQAEQRAFLMLDDLAKRYKGVAQKGIVAIQLRLQGKTDEQIARRFNTKENSVRAWISRARIHMRREGLHLAVSEKKPVEERGLVC